jgi:hypothetical protein
MLGVWLMAAPQVLGYSGPAADNDHIVGPLVVSSAVIAMWEVTRPLRRVNTALGAWLLLAPWLLGYESAAALVNSLVAGGLLMAFSLVRGPRRHRIGGGWSALWRPPEDHPARESVEASSAR